MQKNKSNPPSRSQRIAVNIISLLIVFCMMAAAAMIINHRLLGHSLEASQWADATAEVGDTTVINTSSIAPDIIGYGGPVPVEISIVDGRIDHVEPLPNSETPGFFKRVIESGLFDSWNGMTPTEAINAKVDGVTGATFSSRAAIDNVKAGLATLAEAPAEAQQNSDSEPVDAKNIIVLIVAIAACSLPLFIHNIRYRRLQQLLNVAILGFWGGTFVDYTMMLNITAGGLPAIASITTALLLIAAFIYPLFGHPGYYCANVCPLGSLQELAAAYNPKHRIHLSPKAINALTTFRMILWGALMLCLWTAAWTSWIDYELFAAFIVDSAATGLIIAALLITVLSIFIPRPYCRFVCPTGTILRMSQNISTK